MNNQASSLETRMKQQGLFKPVENSGYPGKVEIIKVKAPEKKDFKGFDYISLNTETGELSEHHSDSAFFEGELNSSLGENEVLYPGDENKDGGPGSGNFGHKGVEGQLGGSAPSDKVELHGGKDNPEITDSIDDYYIPEKTRSKLPEIKKVKSYNDLKEELRKQGIELETGLEKLNDRYADENIESVRETSQRILTAIQTCKDVFGENALSALKKIRLYDEDCDEQASYYLTKIGEDKEPNEGTLVIRDFSISGKDIFHEFAHVLQDSKKGEGEDAVSFSSRVNENVGGSPAKSYFGANPEDAEAEKFAQAFSSAFTRNSESSRDYIQKVKNYLDESTSEKSESKSERAVTGSGYSWSNKEDYEKAKKDVVSDLEKKTEQLRKEEENDKQKLLDSFGGNFRAQRIEIMSDSSLSNEEKLRRIAELKKSEKEYNSKLSQLSNHYAAEEDKMNSTLNSVYDPEYEYPKRKSGPVDLSKDTEYIREQIKDINPDFNMKDPLHSENCQRCVVAAEYVFRGYNVQANATNEGGFGFTDYEIGQAFIGGEWDDIQCGENSCFALREQMKKWGNGSRAIISTTNIMLSGAIRGHVYNVSYIDDTVTIIDTQSSRVWKSGTGDTPFYSGDLQEAFAGRIMRTDNLDLALHSSQAVKEIK